MDSFLQELAQPRPDPGGGAAAAYGARLGLALLEKVVLLEGRRRRPPAGASALTWEQALARLRRLSAVFSELQEADVQAYFKLTAARASGDPGRLASAVREAVHCPQQMLEHAAAALELLSWAGARCQRHLVADLLVAVEFLGAALRGAFYIAGANLPLLTAAAQRRTMAAGLEPSRRAGEALHQQVQADLLARLNASDTELSNS